jgi:23S rRNA (adenine-N6)-dimethyltransferase
VVDLGAGEGALTRPLLDAGARVIAVELHPRRCDTLRARFAGERVTVAEVDAGMFRWPAKPFRVVANPPYAVWAELLRRLLSPGSRLVSADIVLQRRVVRRIVEAAETSRGRARAGSKSYVFERGLAIPRTSFRPPPRVDSAVLRIRRRG